MLGTPGQLSLLVHTNFVETIPKRTASGMSNSLKRTTFQVYDRHMTPETTDSNKPSRYLVSGYKGKQMAAMVSYNATDVTLCSYAGYRCLTQRVPMVQSVRALR